MAELYERANEVAKADGAELIPPRIFYIGFLDNRVIDNIIVGEVAIPTFLYGLTTAFSGGAAIITKAGVAALTNASMTMYENNGNVSPAYLLGSAAKGVGFSLVAQGAGALFGKILSNFTFSSTQNMLPLIKKSNVVLTLLKVAGAKFFGNISNIFISSKNNYITDFLGGLFG